MGLNDDGQMMAVADWVNQRVIYAELQAFKQGAPVDFSAPITLWGLARQFYVEQLEDHTAPGPTFMESEGAVQLACMLDLMRRGAQALDAQVEAASGSMLADIEAMLSPGSELDTDGPGVGPPEAPDV